MATDRDYAAQAARDIDDAYEKGWQAAANTIVTALQHKSGRAFSSWAAAAEVARQHAGRATGRVEAEAAEAVAAYTPRPMPSIALFGTATIQRHGDGTTTVLSADEVIGMSLELWESLGSEHRMGETVIVLDTAGRYRYRYREAVCVALGTPYLIFERIREPK